LKFTIVLSARSDDCCSYVVSFNPACRLCVDGVVYWSRSI